MLLYCCLLHNIHYHIVGRRCDTITCSFLGSVEQLDYEMLRLGNNALNFNQVKTPEHA